MKLIFREISLGLEEKTDALRDKIKKQYGVQVTGPVEILRESIDARKGIVFKYTVAAEVENGQKLAKRGLEKWEEHKPESIPEGDRQLKGRPVIAGFGPCGLFAAYALAERGYQPVVIERGKPIEERAADFDLLRDRGILNLESNVCFGEGGAGAFSDGKLTARIKGRDGRAARVLDLFVKCGAMPAIKYEAKPHLGTDVIRKVVANLRDKIISMGGTVIYSAKLRDMKSVDGELSQIVYEKDGQSIHMDTNALVLAIGHSARDTFEMLLSKGIALEKKPFAIGARVEHKREYIDVCQYGKYAGHPRLGAADYRLTAKSGGRGVYSFCMCPGGEVVCSATEEGMTAVNGMSYWKRDQENSNSAIIVSVRPEDMPEGPLGGIALQRQIERAAYEQAGGFGAAIQTVEDFVKGMAAERRLPVTPSYRPYTRYTRLDQCFPPYIREGIIEGFKRFDRMMPEFSARGLLVGAETRSSSPVRVLRNDRMEGENLAGFYPAGEGAGYAGGIVSSAVDGLRAAEAIIKKFRRPD